MRTDLTERQLHYMRHSLGLTYEKKPYRNYWAANNTAAGDPDSAFAGLQGMCALGLMEQGGTSGQLTYFHVTKAGAKVLRVTLPD